MDQEQQKQVNEAAEKFAEAIKESYQALAEHSVSAQELNAQLAQEFFNGVINNLRSQAKSNRALAEDLIEQQQKASQALTQESVGAYMDFLNSMFSFAQGRDPREEAWDESTHPRDFEGRFTRGEEAWEESEHPRDARGRFEGSAQEGARAGSQAISDVVGTAAGATQDTAESAAGQLPIEGYDEINVDEIRGRLGDLTVDQLQEVKHYEQRNKNRDTLIKEIHRRLTGSA
jgi:hypothetical protein